MSACLLSLSVMSLLLPVSKKTLVLLQHLLDSLVQADSAIGNAEPHYRRPFMHLSPMAVLPMPQFCTSVEEQVSWVSFDSDRRFVTKYF